MIYNLSMKNSCLILLLLNVSLASMAIGQQHKKHHKKSAQQVKLLTGADRTDQYVDYLRNKNIGMVVNPTSIIGANHISSVDSLLKLGIHISTI